MNNNIQIRTAEGSDLPELIQLLYILFSQEADFVPDAKKQERGLRLILETPAHGHILVASSNDKIAGMVNLLYFTSTAEGARVALLEDMVVNPEYRALGIGSRLLEEAVAFAREQGCKRITLLTDSDNDRAIKFYGKQGFTKSNMIPLRLKL